MKKRPRTAAIGSESLDRACYEYLSDQHYVLWGHHFNIQGNKSRREAADWLFNQVQNVLAIEAESRRSGDAQLVERATRPGSP